MMQHTIDNLRELCQMPTLKAALAFCASWALEMVGYPESAIMLLFSLLLFDLALGLSRVWITPHPFRGSRLARWVTKLIGYGITVAVLIKVDGTINMAFPALPISFRDVFIAYFAINEALSCLDHLAFFGVPVPEGLLKRLRVYRDKCLEESWDGVERRDRTQGNGNDDGE